MAPEVKAQLAVCLFFFYNWKKNKTGFFQRCGQTDLGSGAVAKINPHSLFSAPTREHAILQGCHVRLGVAFLVQDGDGGHCIP